VPVTQAAPSARPRAVSLAALQALPGSIGHPVYWAGARPGARYELTRTADGKIYLRYLPRNTPVGTASRFLTVGTYPLANALGVTRRLAGEASAVRLDPGGGGVAFYGKRSPTNVYLAFPGAPVQIEVYDPVPAEARRLVTSGRIVPVG
jgi:hypothetical protein